MWTSLGERVTVEKREGVISKGTWAVGGKKGGGRLMKGTAGTRVLKVWLCNQRLKGGNKKLHGGVANKKRNGHSILT